MPTNCDNCTYNTYICTQCKPGYGLYYGIFNANCVPCTTQNCISCNNNASICDGCSTGQCLNPKINSCVTAQSPCTSCNNRIDNCTNCITGYALMIYKIIGKKPLYNCTHCTTGCT